LGSRSTGPLIGRFHNRPHRLNGFRVESKRSRGRSVLGGFWCKFRSAWVFCLARGFADFLRQVCHVKVKETAGWSGGRGFRRDRRTESRAPVLKHVRQAPVEHGHPNLDQQVGLPWLVLAQPRRIWYRRYEWTAWRAVVERMKYRVVLLALFMDRYSEFHPVRPSQVALLSAKTIRSGGQR
jgi:hypothetical protein